MTPWMFLFAAIVLEVAGTFFLKLSHGFEKWQWGMASIACFTACFWALAPAMKGLPVGLVYAIAAGVGIVVATAIGVFVFNEKLGGSQFAFIGMILMGVVGLRLTASA